MGFGIAILTLLGIGLVVNLTDDDDDNQTSDNQRVEGDDSSETIRTGSGDDTIFAGEGADLVDAGAGDDRVFAGGNTDPAFDDPVDAVFGGEGNDFIRGQAGNDVLFGGQGEDTLKGDSGDDTLFGADLLADEQGTIDMIAETNMVDTVPEEFFDLDNDPGEFDSLTGGVGDDLIVAGSNDLVDTGAGFDIVNLGEWVDPAAPVQIEDFSASSDAIVYSYFGPTVPDVQFGEDAGGTATLEVDGDIVAYFQNASAFDLAAESAIILDRIG